MTIDVRPTRPDEYRAAAAAFSIALMSAPPSDEAWERSLPSWDEMVSLAAWDGERCVGHAGQFLVDTTVPGGARVATGAVSRVGVLPTHRRRGVATALMSGLVRDASDRGLLLMSLRASEAAIYGRYGFGVGGDYCQVAIDPKRATPVAGATATGSFRLLAPDEILDVVPPLYDRVAHRRPGIVTRPASWSRRYFREAIEQSKASFVAVHVDDGGAPDGYVHYDVAWNDDVAPGSTGTGAVHEVVGVDDATELALWQYLFDLDLVTRWTSDERPVDDLVRVAARDPRAYSVRAIEDEQWLRLVDVDAALAARAYGPVVGSVTIGVTDPLLPRNDGTWRVAAEGAERVAAAAELEVDIATLSAVYLGGPSWRALTATGAVRVRRDAPIAVADALFTSRPGPFCGSFF